MFFTGADVNSRNKYGDTPLILASAFGNSDVVEILIAVGKMITDNHTVSLITNDHFYTSTVGYLILVD